MEYKYDRLKGKICEKYKTRKAFADAMNLGNTALSFKLNNKSEWSQDEILKAINLLDLTTDDIKLYFFSH
ncbi:MAG: DUF739 family protein [Clostridia bacterium]|nr:DUF739 family protein [Clostridia bacterium]